VERGCQRCDFCQSLEDENRLFLLDEWNTLASFKINMKSIYYKVLNGAMNLLREPGEMMFRAVFHPERIETAEGEILWINCCSENVFDAGAP